MTRPAFLRKLPIIAAVLTGIGIMMNILLVLNPHIAAVLLGYGSVKELMGTKLSSATEGFMLAQAAVPAVLLILCVITCFSDKINKGKSLLMLIAAPSAYIVISLLSTFIYTLALKSGVSEGINTMSILSSITSARSVLAYLYTFSLLILMCAASVEYYIAKTNDI